MQAGSKGSTASLERVTIHRMHGNPSAASAAETTSSSLELTGARAVRVRHAPSPVMGVTQPLTVSKVSFHQGVFGGREGRRSSGNDSSGMLEKVLERRIHSGEAAERRRKIAEAKSKRKSPWGDTTLVPTARVQCSSGEVSLPSI